MTQEVDSTFHRLGRPDLWALLVTAVATAGLSLLPLLRDSRFYFNDDTEIGAYGLWYRLGEAITEGRLPLIEPTTWMAGNVLVEGQWGVFNPLIWLVGWGAHGASNVVMYASLVKIVTLVVMATGVFVLARSFGVTPSLAVVAGVAVAGNGFTVYLDSTSWVTGLFTTALMPWAWWAIRRYTFTRTGVWAPFLVSWLVATIGYPHGVLALIGAFLAVVLETLLVGQPRRLLRTLGAGALAGAVALAVFLPSVLSVGVTARASGILNNGFLNGNLTGIASSAIPVAQPEIGGWWGSNPPVPMMYISWLLPLFAFVDRTKLGRAARVLVPIAFFGLIWVAFIAAPSFLGPFRIPIRMMPYVALASILILAISLSRAATVSSRYNWRALLAVFLTLYSAWFAFAEVPDNAWEQAISTGLVLVGVLAIGVVLNLLQRIGGRKGGALLVGVAVAMTTVITLHQHTVFPSSPLAAYGLPEAKTDYQRPLSGLDGAAMVVGEPTAVGQPEVWEETLLANTWFLNEARVANVYTPVGFDAYAERLCMNNRGETCAAALDALFSPVADTDLLLVDAMRLDVLQLVTPPVDRDIALTPREGWSVVTEGPFTVTWERNEPVGLPGGEVWTAEGLDVRELSRSEDSIEFEVLAVPSPGSTSVMALSRLAWPGYEVTGGEIVAPLDGIFLQVDLAEASIGDRVVVSFEPPGWGLVRLLLIGSVLVVLGLTTADLWRSAAERRRARQESARSSAAESA